MLRKHQQSACSSTEPQCREEWDAIFVRSTDTLKVRLNSMRTEMYRQSTSKVKVQNLNIKLQEEWDAILVGTADSLKARLGPDCLELQLVMALMLFQHQMVSQTVSHAGLQLACQGHLLDGMHGRSAQPQEEQAACSAGIQDPLRCGMQAGLTALSCSGPKQ